MNKNGMTLVELMVVVGVGAIISLAFATMMQNQQRASKGLSEKVATIDITRAVTSVLSTTATCSAIITTPGNLSTTTLTGGVPQYILVHSILSVPLAVGSSASIMAPEMKLAPAGSATTSGLVLEIQANHMATLHVRFDNSTTVTPLRELQFPDIELAVTGSTITGCGPGPVVVACSKGCGGSYPHEIGGIAEHNWANNDGVIYGTFGNNCASTVLQHSGWMAGGGTSGGAYNVNDTIHFCSK